MDALKFIEERNRMCDYYTKNDVIGGCANCPEFDSACNVVRYVTPEYIADVEKWSQEHPRKTRQDVFLSVYPNAKMDKRSRTVNVLPCLVDKSWSANGCQNNDCAVCRRQFWMQEVE